jgi:2-polyprenyl-6-methoxyphenol hydroxylase-like FAD-dependent oxidoreductase
VRKRGDTDSLNLLLLEEFHIFHNKKMHPFDVCIQGAGAVGMCMALSLARLGLQVALVNAPARATELGTDVRAFALNTASQKLLSALKVWDALPAHAATPVRDMRITGDAPPGKLAFSAWQQRTTELAWITDAALLEQALRDAVRYCPHVSLISQAAEATLLVRCEGRANAQQDRSGQCAIAARLQTPCAHQHTAHQWFNAPDVLALLPFDSPMPSHSFALVWSMPSAQAHAMMLLPDAEFESQLGALTRGTCGPLSLASPRASWPLLHGLAPAWCGPGWALAGDCAHVVHPLAGQGLNLGLADVAALTQVIAEREPWRSVGDAKLLRRYERMRLGPTRAMGLVTDGLLQLFSNNDPALRLLRNQGLGMLNHLSPLKRWLGHGAMNP